MFKKDLCSIVFFLGLASVVSLPAAAAIDAIDDTIAATEDTQAVGNVLADNGGGADDLGTTPTTVTSFDATSVNGGTVTVAANGDFTYDPVGDFCTGDSFTYTITDSSTATDTATVTLNVDCTPEAADDTIAATEDTQAVGNVLADRA